MEKEYFLEDFKLDAIDFKLITLLRKNAKLSSKELANEIGLTITPVYERVKRLEKLKIIQSYEAKIDKTKIGKNLRVLCSVSLNSHAIEYLSNFEEKVVHLQEVSTCFHIAGNFDYLLIVEVKDMQEYASFLKEKLANIPHIGTVQSSFIMKTLKEE